MTIDEINIIIETYNYRLKDKLRSIYAQSKLTAYFVGLAITGKEIPEITRIYPNLEETKQSEADEIAEAQYYEKQFAMFAACANSNRKGK